MLLRVRLESLFFCLPCTVAFTGIFPVAMINSHCQSVHVLERGGFSLFPGKDRILNLIWEPLVMVIVMAQNTILPT